MQVKGFTYGYSARRGDLLSRPAVKSRAKMVELGINYVCFTVVITQKNFHSTDIFFDYKRTPTDREIIATIEEFKNAGVEVCLKPMINSDDGYWRALIDFPDEDMHGNDRYWGEWFSSYTSFMLHYAEIAQDTGCGMLCIGCEMSGTERKEEHWRKLIAKVRAVYKGLITYNTNHGNEESVEWFDSVDIIGTSAYYPVAEEGGESLENMISAWRPISERLEIISKRLNKKILFAEIGCRSALGCAAMPWDFGHTEFPQDEDEQARFYESALTVFAEKDWFMGFFWWDWGTKIYDTKEKANQDTGFNIHLKKAEKVVKRWYV